MEPGRPPENTGLCPINSQPTEMLLKIFDYLSTEENLCLLPRVCQRWKEIQTDRPLYRNVSFFYQTPGTEDCVYVLTQATSLHTLELINRKDAEVILQAVGKYNPTLQSLSLESCQGSGQSKRLEACVLRKVLTFCSGLEELTIKDTSFNTTIFTNLLVLSTPLRRPPTGRYKNSLVSIPINCTRLEKVRLDWHCYFKERLHLFSSKEVRALCFQCKRLKSLEVDALLLKNATMKSISKCSLLTHLHLHHLVSVTGEGMQHLGKLKLLQSLLISYCDIPTNDWVAFFTCENLHILQELSIRCCEFFNDDVVKVIKKFLLCLKSVSVDDCSCVTDVAREIIENIAGNSLTLSQP